MVQTAFCVLLTFCEQNTERRLFFETFKKGGANMEASNPSQQSMKKVMNCLTTDLIQRLDLVAAQKTMSRSLLIRLACERYLRDIETQQNFA